MADLFVTLLGLSLVALGTLISLWLAIVLLIGLVGAVGTLAGWLLAGADEVLHFGERHPPRGPKAP